MFFLLFWLDDRRFRIYICDKWIQIRIRNTACEQPTSPSLGCFSSLTGGGTTTFDSSCSSSLPNMPLISCFFLGEVAATSPRPRDARELFTCTQIYKFKSKPTKKCHACVLSNSPAQQRLTPTSPQGADPYPSFLYAREGR
jgi:hypothetical protein